MVDIRIQDSTLQKMDPPAPRELKIYDRISGTVNQGPDADVDFRSDSDAPDVNVRITARMPLKSLREEQPKVDYAFRITLSSGKMLNPTDALNFASDLGVIARWAEGKLEEFKAMGFADYQGELK